MSTSLTSCLWYSLYLPTTNQANQMILAIWEWLISWKWLKFYHHDFRVNSTWAPCPDGNILLSSVPPKFGISFTLLPWICSLPYPPLPLGNLSYFNGVLKSVLDGRHICPQFRPLVWVSESSLIPPIKQLHLQKCTSQYIQTLISTRPNRIYGSWLSLNSPLPCPVPTVTFLKWVNVGGRQKS